MDQIKVREARPTDVYGIRELEKKVNAGSAPRRADLSTFLTDRNSAGLLAEHRGNLVGALLYQFEWKENRICVRRLTERNAERTLAVRERLLLQLLLRAENFKDFTVYVPAREKDVELLGILRELGFYAVERLNGLFWFSKARRQHLNDDTPDWGDRTDFER